MTDNLIIPSGSKQPLQDPPKNLVFSSEHMKEGSKLSQAEQSKINKQGGGKKRKMTPPPKKNSTTTT